MRVIDILRAMDPQRRRALASLGIFPASIERDIQICDLMDGYAEKGLRKLDAYAEIGRRCFTCDENVRKILRRMNAEI